MRGARWVALALLLAAAPAAAQQATPGEHHPPLQFRFSGYYKSLVSASQSFFTGEDYGDSLNRLRLGLDGRWGQAVSFHLEYDNEAHFGNLTRLPDFQLVRGRQDAAYFDLLHTFVDRPHAYWDTSLYRGYLAFRHQGAVLTLGRQRIGWGTARFWSPADVFNPISPLQVEFDERQGVDAAQLEWGLPRGVRWTLVYAPQDGFNRSAAATRLATTLHNFDVAGFVGRFRQDWMAGGDFAGQWGGAGLRGEATYTWRHQRAEPNALRVVFGSDYAFTNTLYVVGEYFYNQGQPPGFASGQQINPSVLLRFSNEIFTLHRHFLSAGVGYDITPLVRVEGYSVTDLQGPSTFFMPLVKYNLTANTDLTVGGQLFASTTTGEFHGLHQLFFAELLVHF